MHEDKSHLTAITRKKLSKPMQWLLDNGYIKVGDNGLDYGCGKGYDASYMGFDGWDPNYRPDTRDLRTEYDVVTCNYVLNVIEDDNERFKTEFRIINKLAPGGVAFISVRNDTNALNGCTVRGTWQGVVEPENRKWELIECNSKFKLWKYVNTH